MKKFILSLAMSLLALPVSAMTTDDLIGHYAVLEKGELKETIKIEKSRGKYVIFEKKEGMWRRGSPHLTPVTSEQFEKLIKRKIDFPYAGLASKHAAVFKVPAGWNKGKFKTDTGYFVFLKLGPVELVKQ